MKSHSTPTTPDNNSNTDTTWVELYAMLRPVTRHLIYSFNVSSWRGQENDIAEDVVQETALRLFERSEKAKSGEASSICSLKNMAMTTTYNRSVDMIRRDRRLVRVATGNTSAKLDESITEQIEYAEIATENVYRETIFTQAAREIAKFPAKQKHALLVDLANHMSFDTQPTPLQKAFLAVGIQLRHYQQPLSTDPKDHSRYQSLLQHAYKRLARLGYMQKHVGPT